MNKFVLLLAAGLVFGSISIASAAQPPDYVRDLHQWMGRDTNYENRWDPAAQRYTSFEDRIRTEIEKAYRSEGITREEYQDLRAQLANFDDHLSRALRDGRISWVDKRHLETQQEEVMGSLREALINGEYYPYPEPHNY